jgi:hypothetical protein
VSLFGEDGSRTLLLLQERGGDEDPGTGGIVPFLHVVSGDDHGIEFLAKLGVPISLAGVVDGHPRCSRRREVADP